MARADVPLVNRERKAPQFAHGQGTSRRPIDLFTDAEWRQLGGVLELTPRQWQIAQMMCEGLTYKAIAAQACISINTVRMHMRALFAKLGVHDRVGFILQLIAAQRLLAGRGPTARGE
jgi:DNA-binding NarL/FixJ family response regulator